jgi:uncharacterized protein YgiM (DUF1202 family)
LRELSIFFYYKIGNINKRRFIMKKKTYNYKIDAVPVQEDAPAPQELAYTRVRVKDSLNVRENSSLDSSIISILNKGYEFEVKDETEEWYFVESLNGWVMKNYCEKI